MHVYIFFFVFCYHKLVNKDLYIFNISTAYVHGLAFCNVTPSAICQPNHKASSDLAVTVVLLLSWLLF